MFMLLSENFKVSFEPGLFDQNNVTFQPHFNGMGFTAPLFKNKNGFSSPGLEQVSGILLV